MTEPDDRTYGDVGTKLRFENADIRVWELRLEPGAESDLHHHRHDYVMVQVAGDRVAARFEPDSEGTFAGSDYIEGRVKPGAVVFATAGGRETAVNVGDETFHEVVVELKDTPRDAPAAVGTMAVQHVSLSVRDHDASIGFYTDVLGLAPLDRPDLGIAGSWLAASNVVAIHLIEDPNFQPVAGPHVAFETADMAAEVARLRAHGVHVDDPFELNGALQTFFYDPSGNQFELNQPASPA